MQGFTAVLVYTGALWVGFFLILKIIESFYGAWIQRILDEYNLSISLGNIRWYTERLNPLFYFFGRKYKTFFDVWFSVGVIFGFVAASFSVFLLVWNLLRIFLQPKEQPILTPIVPGVNVPQQQLLPYFLSLLVSGIFHEIGHAIAAVSEKKTISGFGIFLFFLYPGAFVDIRDDLAANLSSFRQLKIYCAGVWHNFVLCAFAFFMLTFMAFFILPGYTKADGVVVMRVPQESPLFGHVAVGSVLTHIEDKRVHSREEWDAAFVSLLSETTRRGYCFIESKVDTGGNLSCCDPQMWHTTSQQCFEYTPSSSETPRNVCMSARRVVADSGHCQSNSDCGGKDSSLVCFRAVTPPNERLLTVTQEDQSFFVFSGEVAQLWWSMEVGDFRPKFSWLPFSLPALYESSCRYLISLSLALAVLNVAPVFYLDGEYSLRAFIGLIPGISDSKKQKVLDATLWSMSGLLIVNVVLSLYYLM